MTESFTWKTSTAISGPNGVASNTVALPDCTGNNQVIHNSSGYTWRTRFDIGAWHIKVDDTDPEKVGVGGSNVPIVYLGHICSQIKL